MSAARELTALIGRCIDGEGIDGVSISDLQGVYNLAFSQDMEALFIYAVEKFALTEGESLKRLASRRLLAYKRYVNLKAELSFMHTLFTERGIDYIPLKGAVIREYYPEPYLRESCDIDILVREESLEGAIARLTEALEYKVVERGSHDVALEAPSGVVVELHFALVEKARLPVAGEVLAAVWQYAERDEGARFKLSYPMLYFYHIAHMAKHISNGGCGIRPFLDMYIMDKRECDVEARDKLLSEGGLLTLANYARELSLAWFSGGEHSETTLAMEEFILKGGNFGSFENRAAVGKAKRGGRLSYILCRIIAPYGILKERYPILKKHKWLTPIYQVRRWLSLLSPRAARRAGAELSATVSDKDSERVASLMKTLEL